MERKIWHYKLIAKLTSSLVILGCGSLLWYATVYQIPITNGVKELTLLLLGGAIAFLWRD